MLGIMYVSCEFLEQSERNYTYYLFTIASYMYHFAYLALLSTKKGVKHRAFYEQNMFSLLYNYGTIIITTYTYYYNNICLEMIHIQYIPL